MNASISTPYPTEVLTRSAPVSTGRTIATMMTIIANTAVPMRVLAQPQTTAAALRLGVAGGTITLTRYPPCGGHVTVVRLVAWNCRSGFHRKLESLAVLAPDVAVVSECASPEILASKAPR